MLLLSLIKSSAAAAGSVAAAAAAAAASLFPLLARRPAANKSMIACCTYSISTISKACCWQQQTADTAVQHSFVSSAAAGVGCRPGEDGQGSSSHKRHMSSLRQQLQEQLDQAVDELGTSAAGSGQAGAQGDAGQPTVEGEPRQRSSTSSRTTRSTNGSCSSSEHSTSDSYGPSNEDLAAELALYTAHDYGVAQGPDHKLLTTWIKQARTLADLQQLVQQHGSIMNYIHLSAAVNMLGSWQRDGKLSSSQQQSKVQQLLADIEQLLGPPVLEACGSFALAQLVWGLGLLGHTSTGLFGGCLDLFMRQLHRADRSQHVSNVLYGAAKAGWKLQRGQVQQLLAALVRLLPAAETQHVVNSLWAVAKLKQSPTEQQLQQLLAALVRLLPDAKPQDVTNSLWACAQLRMYPTELFAALDSQQQWGRLLPAMNGQELANTALACAVFDHRDDALLGALLLHAVQIQRKGDSTDQCTIQGLCNLCWSAALLDMQQLADNVVELMQEASSQQRWKDMAPEEATQLQQVHQWLLDRQLAGGKGLAGALTEERLQQCRKAWTAQLHAAAEPPSAIQQQVLTAVQQLTASGVLLWQRSPVLEQLAMPDGACLVDIAGVTADGVRLAIEVDGPTHFLLPDRRLTGSTQHRNRLLAARGYAVVSVPYFEWNCLNSPKERQQYLLLLINAAIKTPGVKARQVQHRAACGLSSNQRTQPKGKLRQKQKRPRGSS